MDVPVNRLLYRAFKNEEAYIQDLYSTYQRVYDIPILEGQVEVDEEAFFDYVKRRKFFVNVLPYTRTRKVLLTPTYFGDEFAWRILGGGIKHSFDSNFVTVGHRKVEQYIPDVSLGEIEPVAFLKNVFHYRGETFEHLGILFIGRIRNVTEEEFSTELRDSGAHLVPIGYGISPPKLPQMYQANAFELAVDKIKEALEFSHQDHEIDTNKKYRSRYEFHARFTKPILRFLSRFFGKHSLQKYDELVEQEILKGQPATLLDVACGENLAHINLVRDQKISVFVGNDISWSQIQLIDSELTQEAFRDNRGLVLFTNNDGRRLPFGDNAFDVVVCKNVLHHMPDEQSVQGLLSEAKRVGVRTVIVEVHDPEREGLWARVRHRYYLDFLKDAGGNFLSKDEFLQLTDDAQERYELNTVRGVYQVAIYEERD